MAITEAEVLLAAHGLSRHKAASEGGFNNNFYTDTATLLMPALVIISKEIVNEAHLPLSFLAALIIPLRKKVTWMTRWSIDQFRYYEPATRCLLKRWQRDYKLHYLELSATLNRALFMDAK